MPETQHIVITGANRGIGLELCRQSVEGGQKVTALCRKASQDLKNLEIEIVENVDITDPPPLDQLGPIDTLLLNAGIWRNETLEDLNFETITEQFKVNSIGPLRVFRRVQHLLKTGSKIGLMSSQMGSMADNTSGGRYGYRASKAALNCFGVSLSHDLKERGIAVAILHPGYVATDMTDHKGSISPEESVTGLLRVMDSLNLENSGTFWNYQGREIPW